MKNQVYKGAKGKESLIDLTLPDSYSGKLVLFVHGYMGFKDWGCWNLVEDYFLNLGFGFCKYNVSHNGCSTEDSQNFVDLDSFSINNYSYELKDLDAVINYISQQIQPLPELLVIGHSRGGGVALLTANDSRIKKVATWASISDIGSRFPAGEALDEWKKTEYYHRKNGRTHQEMPHHFSQYLDFKTNEEKLDIEEVTKGIQKPLLLIHGDADKSVRMEEGKALAEWTKTDLKIIENAAHTFGSSHPWLEDNLPEQMEQVCRITAQFFLEND